MSDVDNFIEQKRTAAANSLAEKSKALYELLVTNVPAKQLPERIFVESFLPYFSGTKEISNLDQVLVNWVGVAGTPMDEVEIIDEQGKALYRVPPIIDTSIINPMRSENNNVGIYSIIALANQYRNNIPAVGERVLTDNLAIKAKELQKKSEVFEQNEKRWIEIFKRYNIAGQTNTPQLSNNSGNLTDDDLVF